MISLKRRSNCRASLVLTPDQALLLGLSPDGMVLKTFGAVPLPSGVWIADRLVQIEALKQALAHLFQQSGANFKEVHVSLPAALLRVVEPPKVAAKDLKLALSSEAEQFRAFDQTEAVVDYALLSQTGAAGGQSQAVMGAVRQDTLDHVTQVLSQQRLRVASVDLNPLNTLRAMAGTGVLSSLVQQIGAEAVWGMLTVETDRVRLLYWRGNQLLDIREMPFQTAPLLQNPPNAMSVKDLAEEIQLSSRSHQPVIWLTDGLPTELNERLTQEVGCVVRPCFLGQPVQGLPESAPTLVLPAVGSALHDQVQFPFRFNLSSTSASSPLPSVGQSASHSASESVSGPAAWLPKAAGGIAAVMLIAWGVLSFMGSQLAAEIAEAEAQQQQTQGQISALTAEVAQLKVQFAIQAALVERVKTSRQRNQVYEELARDLRERTPGQLWLHQLSVGDTLTMQGKALNHQSVLNFARQFDDVPYARALLIANLKEDTLSGQKVFDFKLDGPVSFAPPAPAPQTANAAVGTP